MCVSVVVPKRSARSALAAVGVVVVLDAAQVQSAELVRVGFGTYGSTEFWTSRQVALRAGPTAQNIPMEFFDQIQIRIVMEAQVVVQQVTN
jgi:hypothetical protein